MSNKAAIQRLKSVFGSQLDDDSIAAVLAVCEDDVNRAIKFLQAEGDDRGYDVNALAQNNDAIPPDYPIARHPHHFAEEDRKGEEKPKEKSLVDIARGLFTSPASTLREHFDFQREHYAEYVSVLLLLLHEGVEIQRSSRPRIIAAAWARHDFNLVDVITKKYDEIFQLPQILGALEMIDARRQIAAIQKKLDKYAAEGCKNPAKIGPLRSRLTELSREEPIGSLTNSVVKHAKKWVRNISADHLIFYALALPKEPWRELANLLHLAPTDFADIEGKVAGGEAPAEEGVPAAAPAAAAEEKPAKPEGPKKGKGKGKGKRSPDALRNTFLGYVFDESTATPDSLLHRCKHVNEANVVSLVTNYNVPYSFIRTVVKPLPTEAKPIIARKMSLDQLIWYHEELACPEVNTVLRKRLRDGEKPTLGYGKLMERLMYFESVGLPFAEMLLPTAEECLRSIQLALEPPVYCFGDASYSMDVAIRCSTIIGSVLASLTNAELRFFNDKVIQLPKTPHTTREVMDAVNNIHADGMTAPACSLWQLYRERVKAKFIIMVTDEVENVKSEGLYWPTLYQNYVREVAPECTAVFISFLGGGAEKGRMVRALESLGITKIIQFRLEGGRPDLTKLDTILGLLAAESRQFPDQIRVLVGAYEMGGLTGILERLKLPLLSDVPIQMLMKNKTESGDKDKDEPKAAEVKADSAAAVAEPKKDPAGMEKCSICMERNASIAMVPCGHLCCCEPCSHNLELCPVCRAPVTKTQVIYMAGVN